MQFARIIFAGAVFFGLGCELPEEDGLATDQRSEPTSLDDSIDHKSEAIAHDSQAIDKAIDEAGENSPLLAFRGSVWSFQPYNFPGRHIRHRNFLGYIEPVFTALDKSDATFSLVPGLANSDCISFQSYNFPNHYLRHQGFRIKLHQKDLTSQLFKEDATFCLQPGLANGSAVSFESYNFPGYFLRHTNFELWISADTGEPFASDATFWVVSPWVAR